MLCISFQANPNEFKRIPCLANAAFIHDLNFSDNLKEIYNPDIAFYASNSVPCENFVEVN